MSVINTVLSPDPDPALNVELSFYNDNPDGPVCIQIPGIRSKGRNTPDNQQMRDKIRGENISVISFDYGGCASWVKCKDRATFDSHISDTKLAIDFAGARDNILLAQSGGITMALANATERTRGIVAAMPGPDLYQNLYKTFFAHKSFSRDKPEEWVPNVLYNAKRDITKAALHVLMNTRGYYCWTSTSRKDRLGIPYIKITKDFMDSAGRNRIADVIERNPHRPPVHCVVNEGDRMGPSVIQKFCDQLNRAGYSTSMEVIEGAGHGFVPGTMQAILQGVRKFVL